MNEQPLVFHVREGDAVRVYNLSADLLIDETALGQEFAKQPARLAWWSSLYESAQHAFKEEEGAFEIWQAKRAYEIRRWAAGLVEAESDPNPEKPKRGRRAARSGPTEAGLIEMLRSDPQYTQMRERVEAARYLASQLRSAVRAVMEKGEMLRSFGANKRHEIEALNYRTFQDRPFTVDGV